MGTLYFREGFCNDLPGLKQRIIHRGTLLYRNVLLLSTNTPLTIIDVVIQDGECGITNLVKQHVSRPGVSFLSSISAQPKVLQNTINWHDGPVWYATAPSIGGSSDVVGSSCFLKSHSGMTIPHVLKLY